MPHANIKHGFLGSLVLYSLDPTITSAKLQEQIQIHPNQFPYATFKNIQIEKYNRIFTYVADWIKCYADVETQLPKMTQDLEEIQANAQETLQKGRDLFPDIAIKQRSKMVSQNASTCKQIIESCREILGDLNTDIYAMREALELTALDMQ